MRPLAVLAALSALVAVAAGAFGAHGAPSEEARDWLQTGGQYQLAHALAVFAALFIRREGGGAAAGAAAWMFLGGGAVFGAALYATALTGAPGAGLLAPVGGLAMLLGWASLAVAGLRVAKRPIP